MSQTTLGPDLATIDERVTHLFDLVGHGVTTATDVFLSGDREGANAVVAADPVIDDLQNVVEELAQSRLCDRSAALDDADLRLLLSVLRIVPELERSGDLVEHIALRAVPGLVGQLTPRARGLIAHMGEVASEMWRTAAQAYVDRDPHAAMALRARDDELDDLHVLLTSELAEGSLSTAAAIELGLVARFLERLGDHAVNVTRRLNWLAATPVSAP
jgi:phosphate transport system protein